MTALSASPSAPDHPAPLFLTDTSVVDTASRPLAAAATTRAGSLKRRLVGVFLAVLALSLVGSAIGGWSLLRIHASTEAMVDRSVANERLVADAFRLQAINAERYKAVALSSEPEVGEILGADIARTQQDYDARIAALAERLSTPAEREQLQQVVASGAAFAKARTDLIAARDSGLTERIRKEYADHFLPASQTLLQSLNGLTQSQRQGIDEAAGQVAELSRLARLSLLGFGTLALVLGTVLALWLVRSITRPIALAGATADRVAGFDLRHDIAGHGRDETGRMLHSLSVMQAALRTLVGRVSLSVQNLRTASAEIANGNAELSQRTEATAANLQETAAALEHVTRKVQESELTTERTEALAAQAAATAQAGSGVVTELVGTMEQVSQSAHRIADITGVIDSIAFQTNILALNAAVEAARAGEQGRGFAVVANEVRSLATRSAEAAREIKALIAASLAQVQGGSRLAGEAGRTMGQVVASIQQAAHTMVEIKAAHRSQNEDIAAIHGAMSRLDDMTQQNAALVEESAAAADSLRAQAHDLSVLVSRFLLPEREALPAAA